MRVNISALVRRLTGGATKANGQKYRGARKEQQVRRNNVKRGRRSR